MIPESTLMLKVLLLEFKNISMVLYSRVNVLEGFFWNILLPIWNFYDHQCYCIASIAFYFRIFFFHFDLLLLLVLILRIYGCLIIGFKLVFFIVSILRNMSYIHFCYLLVSIFYFLTSLFHNWSGNVNLYSSVSFLLLLLDVLCLLFIRCFFVACPG